MLNRYYAVLLSLIITLTGLEGCTSENIAKLKEFEKRLEVSAKSLQKGSKLLVQLPHRKANEMLIAINGNYMGTIMHSLNISTRLAEKIMLDYGASESGTNYVLLIREQQIICKSAFSIYNFATQHNPLQNNAKVALPHHRFAVIQCQIRKDKLKMDLWNNICIAELSGFQ